MSVKGFSETLQSYQVLSVRGQLHTNVIRRNADGLRITVDLGRSDKERAIAMLRELIGEIDAVG